MPTANEWRYLRNRYKNLKSNSNSILSELDDCSSLISSVSRDFSKAIIVEDDDSFNGNNFSLMDNSLSEVANKLRNTGIPAINNKIYEINREIEKAEAAEAEAG